MIAVTGIRNNLTFEDFFFLLRKEYVKHQDLRNLPINDALKLMVVNEFNTVMDNHIKETLKL